MIEAKAYLRHRPYESPTLFTSKRRDPINRRQLDTLMKHYGELADIPESNATSTCSSTRLQRISLTLALICDSCRTGLDMRASRTPCSTPSSLTASAMRKLGGFS
jgi:hypothetical protein